MNGLRRVHGLLGFATLAAFLATGAYMLLVAHPSERPEGAHLMYVSRHIYILAAACTHLALGAYAAPLATRGRRAAQWAGAALLALSSVLLVSAFVVEPVAGRMRTPVSSFGVYALLAGVLLHVIAATRRGPEGLTGA